MRRIATVALVAGGLLAGWAGAVGAGQWKSPLQVFAENPGARFNPRVQVLLVEQRLRRLEPVELYPPYLGYQEGAAGVDQQIRRLGDLIRRDEGQ